MLKHIAVILRGQERTWGIIHPYIFKFYDSIATNVDYYFATWKLPDRDYSNTINTFKDRNLIAFELALAESITVPTRLNQAWRGPAYLTYRLLPHMRKRTNQITYDMIIDTRPDVIYKLRPNKSIITPEANTLYTSMLELHHNYIFDRKEIAISDHFFTYDFDTAQKLADRYIAECPYGNQIQHRRWLEENNIGLSTIDWIEAHITRPTIYKAIDNIEEDSGICYQLAEDWMNMSPEDKIELCNRFNIALPDYLDSETYHTQIYHFNFPQ